MSNLVSAEPKVVAEIPDNLLLPIVCPPGEERASFFLSSPENLPEDFKIGLPTDLPDKTNQVIDNRSIRIDACLRSDDSIDFHRLVWKPNHLGLSAIASDPDIAEIKEVTTRVGDIRFNTYRVPTANIEVVGLDKAAHGEPGDLNISVNYSRSFGTLVRNFRMSVSGMPRGDSDIVRFWEGIRDNDDKKFIYNKFYAGKFEYGDPFHEGVCASDFEKKQHKWLFAGRSLELTLCWRNTGSPLAGFTRNYYATEAKYFDGETTLVLEDKEQIDKLIRLEVRHHNFTDCMALNLESEVAVISLRKDRFSNCSVGDEFRKTEKGYLYGIYRDGEWTFGDTSYVVEPPRYDEWPLD